MSLCLSLTWIHTYILGSSSHYLTCNKSENFVVLRFISNFCSLGSRMKNIMFCDFWFSQAAIRAKIRIVRTEMRQSIYWKVIGKQYNSDIFFFFFFFTQSCNKTWIWNSIAFVTLRMVLNETDKSVTSNCLFDWFQCYRAVGLLFPATGRTSLLWNTPNL